jgi:hypothetical protein
VWAGISSGGFALVLISYIGAVQAAPAISATAAKKIGCAAIQSRYPNDGYKCSALSVVIGGPGGTWTGNWLIHKPIHRTQKLGGTPYAVISRGTGQVIEVGYVAE